MPLASTYVMASKEIITFYLVFHRYQEKKIFLFRITHEAQGWIIGNCIHSCKITVSKVDAK
jgi:hypothetical protein